ncbi:hypothetical protein A11Q_2329 [Pseudobdellovibrio exovorus JSS]|uniref:Uncharacterized protein n=1 Tax=Pseudobdellovibrio exovorus JSS TaxID=1184267 RepID=M4VDJ4_9BACT|nr:hypothetical protein A11Q_2329 [Pseudobdellovibrio exovorus JSS]
MAMPTEAIRLSSDLTGTTILRKSLLKPEASVPKNHYIGLETKKLGTKFDSQILSLYKEV